MDFTVELQKEHRIAEAVRSGAGIGRLKSIGGQFNGSFDECEQIVRAFGERGNGILTAWWLSCQKDMSMEMWQKVAEHILDGLWSVATYFEITKNKFAIEAFSTTLLTKLIFKLSMLGNERSGTLDMASLSAAYIVTAMDRCGYSDAADKICKALTASMGESNWIKSWLRQGPPECRARIEKYGVSLYGIRGLLCEAAAGGEPWRVETALSLGAAVSDTDEAGRGAIETLLEFAQESKQDGRKRKKKGRTLEILMEIGCSLTNEMNKSTILHWLAHSPGMVSYIPECVLRVYGNQRDKEKETPLHWAAKRRNPKVFYFLCENGCNLYEKNSSGLTPLESASKEVLTAYVRYEQEKLQKEIVEVKTKRRGRL